LYASHLGWLNSTVKVRKGKKQEESLSKLEYYGNDSFLAETPPLDESQYIVEMWNMLGKARSNGFGIEQIPWTEIKAFIDVNQISLWEAKLLHMMSKIFVDYCNSMKDKECEAPYRKDDLPMDILLAQSASSKLALMRNKPQS
jgi:hypothetical protein